jgi:type IV pilus assembly protein PilA
MNKIWKKKKKAFTLIELIIVIAIIAILSAIAVPNFIALRNKTRNNADVQSCQTIRKAVQVLVSDGTLSSTAASTFTVTFTGGITPVVTQTVGSTTGAATAIQSSLSNITGPQGFTMVSPTTVDLNNPNAITFGTTTAATAYTITVDIQGTVQVYTD